MDGIVERKGIQGGEQMGDSVQMYRTLISALWAHIPRCVFGDVRRLMTLAWAVIGLCLTKKVSFNHWGEVVTSNAQYAASHERRFRRWLNNKCVVPATFYPPLLQAALADWQAGERVYVALDTTVLPGGYVLIRTALIYRGRALPVAWRVLKHDSAAVSYADYEPVLRQTRQALPQGLVIVLLADRGFLHRKLVLFAQQHGWHYRLRAKASTLVRLWNGQVLPLAKLRPPTGAAHFYRRVHILGEDIGPVDLALATPPPKEAGKTVDPWYVVSDEPADVSTFDEYGLRFDIEENFLDDKSNGFQVEASKLDDAQAISRLFLILAVATLHFTSVGVGVVKSKMRRWVDTHWDRGMSYLKIGWSWLRQQHRRDWQTFAPFWLDPAPDPEPAIASRRQAARPKRQWVVSCFGFP
jgi:hypothetical protein